MLSILRKLPGVGKNLPTFYGLFPGFTYFGMFCLQLNLGSQETEMNC